MRARKKLQACTALLTGIVLLLSVLFTQLAVLAKERGAYAQESTQEGDAEMRLHYDEPASEGTMYDFPSTGMNVDDAFDRWQQTVLPIGNGAIGATVWGEKERERITFNEKTLWTGGPSDSRPGYNGGNKTGVVYDGMTMAQLYEKIQELFLAGKTSEASALCAQLVGEKDGYGAYQAWGDIYLDFGITASAASYERGLDLETGTAYVEFTADGTSYSREYFVSYPDNVLVIRLTSDKEMTVGVEFESAQGAEQTTADGVLTLAGSLADNGMLWHSVLRAADGSVRAEDGEFTVTGKAITLIVAAATDYKNDYPSYRTGETASDLAARVGATAAAAAEKGYDALYAAHEEDYTQLYDRMSVGLGQSDPGMATDDLLQKYKNGKATDGEERYLEVLLYQYGRYLTIASSREGNALPSNLQGLWNPVNDPPWSSDYHMNINLQMNYWPTYASNLAECAIPLIEYVDSLREPGRVTAEVYTGVRSGEGEENGYTAHTQNTPFGWTCPGWQFSWGWSPAAVPWILQNVYEYFEYTQDEDYLREKIYPMMREEAVYFDQILIEDPSTGRLLTAPAYSPEHGPYTMGNTYEQTLIWQLYEDTIAAAQRLGTDTDKVEEWTATQAALMPIEVGESGQIKEWYDETALGKNESGSIKGYQSNHRHMSHLLGLFPGDLINRDDNEENGWLDAAVVSLEARGDQSTGWAMGHRLNAWARVGDGEHAYSLVRELFENGIYPNLFDAHPPFQIDGNFAYTSGVNEMLMQSNLGYIELLPALPSEWSSGSVQGMVARGNFELDFSWEKGCLQEVSVLSRAGGECTLRYPGIAEATVTDANGSPVEVTVIDEDKISFDTQEGGRFTVGGVPYSLPKVSGTQAVRLDTDEVRLSWSPIEGAEGYIIRRRKQNGEWKILAKTAETQYTDIAFLAEEYDGLEWSVSAYSQDGESSSATLFGTPVDYTQGVGSMHNDDDEMFVYSDGWEVQDNFSISYQGDVHWATDEASVSFEFCGTGFIVYGRRHAVFAVCDVYVDGECVQEAVSGYNAGDYGYLSGDPAQAAIVTVEGLGYGVHEVELRFYADPGNPSRKRVDFDGVETFGEDTAVKHLVTFDGGAGTGEQPYYGRVREGAEFTLPECGYTAPDGMEFAGWSDGTHTYAAGERCTMPEGGVSFTAVWREIGGGTFTVTVTGGTGGGEYERGAYVSVTADAPAEGMVFKGWEMDGKIVSERRTYSFIVNSDVELSAVYEAEAGTKPVTPPDDGGEETPSEAPVALIVGLSVGGAVVVAGGVTAAVLIRKRKK